ncbi:hypothetical protein NC651_017491 [Populus alba x Populus x berolinensis]|nr:hypothetical protein NC651_017491 [Populus alba x Populus x berolinensis]
MYSSALLSMTLSSTGANHSLLGLTLSFAYANSFKYPLSVQHTLNVEAL